MAKRELWYRKTRRVGSQNGCQKHSSWTNFLVTDWDLRLAEGHPQLADGLKSQIKYARGIVWVAKPGYLDLSTQESTKNFIIQWNFNSMKFNLFTCLGSNSSNLLKLHKSLVNPHSFNPKQTISKPEAPSNQFSPNSTLNKLHTQNPREERSWGLYMRI